MPDFVISGGITSTGTSLTGTITACVALIEGRRVSVSETSKAFTANKDTYVDIAYSEDVDSVVTGSLQYSEVANGAAEPSIASNGIRLMRVVTNTTGITEVTDFRALNAGVGMGAPVGV